ncbi:MAG: MATE family efflux transporter [Lachnospiraceae bacterium]|nr:MATE family efflux transporter [Lachnospiraceae bacterium]
MKSRNDMKNGHDLTDGNILKGFLLFALPLLFGSLFQQLYSTVDLLYIGNFMGKNSAAAVGASGIVVTCMIGLFTGISVGAGVVASHFWGAGEKERVKRCICNSLLFALIGGCVLAALSELMSGWMLRALNTPDSILTEALVYIRIYIFAIVPMILYNMSAELLRAMGDSRSPFLVLAAGGVLNVCMDAAFIVLLRWGVAGAAFATAISQTFTAVVLTGYLFIREKLMEERWRIETGLLRNILKTGFPLGIQSMVLTLSNIFVQRAINGFGENAIAAFTVYFRVENLLYLPIVAFGQAMVTFTGQNMGAGKYERIRKSAFFCNFLAAAVTAALAFVFLLSGRQILGLFCSDEDVVAEGLKIITISFPLYFLYAIQEVTGGLIRGMGKTLQSMAVVMGTLCILRVVLLGLLLRYVRTIQGIASVYPLTWGLAALSFIMCYFYFQKQLPVHRPCKK